MDLELKERYVGHKGPTFFIPAKPHFVCYVRLISHSCMSKRLIKPIKETWALIQKWGLSNSTVLVHLSWSTKSQLFFKPTLSYHLPCARPCSKSLTNINWFDHHDNLMRWVLLLFSLKRSDHWNDVGLDGVLVAGHGVLLLILSCYAFFGMKDLGNTRPHFWTARAHVH